MDRIAVVRMWWHTVLAGPITLKNAYFVITLRYITSHLHPRTICEYLMD